MPTVRPFAGYLVAAQRVVDVVAPGYDALAPAERRRFAQSHPHNYVNAMQSLEEFAAAERPPLDELLARNRAHLQALIEQGAFRETGQACLFIYRLRSGSHEQVGLVGEIPVDEYDQGVIRRHECTQTGREDQLVRYNDVVGAASSPVCLTYAHHAEIDAIVARHMQGPPLIDFVAEDGVAQSLWCIDDTQTQARLAQCFQEVGQAYLTDGHHRAAAGSRFARLRRRQHPQYSGEEAFNWLLVALFPDDQMRILAYNRYVSDLNGYGVDALLTALGRQFTLEHLGEIAAADALPARAREFSVLLAGHWYRLRVDAGSIRAADPVESLDISILHERILGPLLGIRDVRCDARCESVAGAAGMEGLVERCAGGGVGFACHPVSIHQLMAVADAGGVMPPKSTWFDPKVRSGLFLRMR